LQSVTAAMASINGNHGFVGYSYATVGLTSELEGGSSGSAGVHSHAALKMWPFEEMDTQAAVGLEERGGT